MKDSNQIVGRYGEWLASRHLLKQGLVLLDRNWRCPSGELDVVARDGDEVVFIEVKTRRGTGFGQPAESVVAGKGRRLRATAAQWLAAGRTEHRKVRFDVIGIMLTRNTVAVQHLRGVL